MKRYLKEGIILNNLKKNNHKFYSNGNRNTIFNSIIIIYTTSFSQKF